MFACGTKVASRTHQSATIVLCSGALLQLDLMGWSPASLKPVGDLLVCIAVLLALSQKWARGGRVRAFRATLPGVYLSYTGMVFVYSCIRWHEVMLCLQEGRRWLIAGVYWTLLLSGAWRALDRRLLRIFLFSGTAVVSLLVLLVKRGFTFHQVFYTVDVQGGLSVTKVFLPGTFLLFVVPVILLCDLFQPSLRAGRRILVSGLLLGSIGVAVSSAEFRGWVAALCGGLLIVLLGAFRTRRRNSTVCRALATLFIIACSVTLVFQDSLEARFRWLQSAVTDYVGRSGSIQYRYETYDSRVRYLFESGSMDSKLSGLGFVHPHSEAAQIVGFSTETNDAGWAEILLTGGWAGAAVLYGFYCCVLMRFVSTGMQTRQIGAFGAGAVWAMGIVLSYSSNILLWDFGVVPVALAICTLLPDQCEYVLRPVSVRSVSLRRPAVTAVSPYVAPSVVS